MTTRPAPTDVKPAAGAVDRRFALAGLAMLATAGVAIIREPSAEIDLLGRHKLDDIIPRVIGPWRFVTSGGLVVPPEDQLSQQLYAQLVTRTYAADGLPSIMLLITQGHGQTGVVQIHRPEICYPAGGYRLTGAHLLDIPVGDRTLQTEAFTATADNRIEQLLYWTRVGYELPTRWADQRFAVARANLAGQIPDAALIRISTIMGDSAVAFAVISQFVEALLGSVTPSTRTFLIGP